MERNNGIKSQDWIHDRLAMLPPEEEWRPGVSLGLQSLHMQIERRRTRHSKFMWSSVCAVTVLALVMAFPTTRLLAARYLSACMNLFGPTTKDAPRLVYTAGTDRVQAPDLIAVNNAGVPFALSAVRGKVVLLTFSKADCDACDKEHQWFTDFQQTYSEQDFVFLHREVGAGEDVVSVLGRRQTIPATLLIDKSGRIAVTHVGLCTKREYQTAIETLLNEK